MILSDLLGYSCGTRSVRTEGLIDFSVCFGKTMPLYLWVENGVRGHLNLNPVMGEL
jgi:hypothetical protein